MLTCAFISSGHHFRHQASSRTLCVFKQLPRSPRRHRNPSFSFSVLSFRVPDVAGRIPFFSPFVLTLHSALGCENVPHDLPRGRSTVSTTPRRTSRSTTIGLPFLRSHPYLSRTCSRYPIVLQNNNHEGTLILTHRHPTLEPCFCATSHQQPLRYVDTRA